MEEHYYADNHLSNVQDDGNALYAWKCVTYTLEGCKSESLNVHDHESTQMGDLAFVLESSKHTGSLRKNATLLHHYNLGLKLINCLISLTCVAELRQILIIQFD